MVKIPYMDPILSYDELRQVLAEQREEVKYMRGLPLVAREKAEALAAVLEKRWIKVIMGVRRCGKSILVHLALREKKYIYVNFDDERLIGLRAVDLNKILQFSMELNPGTQILFFDEIQNVEGWELFVNRLQRQGYNVIITGSNSKLLSKELATHLTGRYISIELMPFSFAEFLRAKDFQWTESSLYKTQDRAALYSYLGEYLVYGGFPDMVVQGFNPSYLRELYDKIISRDITYRYYVKYSNTLKEIALYCHANLGNRLTFHKTKNAFDISSIHTVKNYFQYLVDAYLIFLLNNFSFKYKEQIKNPRKVYTIDNGFSSAISPKFTQDRGAALENLVFQELYRRQTKFSYFSSQEGEVDFVIHNHKRVDALIQVAYEMRGADVRRREIKALVKASHHLRCNTLMVLTWEEEGTEKVEGRTISVIPIWKWLLRKD